MSITDSFISELQMEAATTRRLLACVPEGKMDWQPHPRAMALGQLVQHVAEIPSMTLMMEQDSLDMSDFHPPALAVSSAAAVATLDAAVESAVASLGRVDDAKAMGSWSLMQGDRTIVTMPRTALYRSILLNHWYHHRGQLSTYLRMLDVKLPSIYGPSADENPFA